MLSISSAFPPIEMYGLSNRQIKTLLKILSARKDGLAQVKLFGSRARGDYKKFSDVDLAIKFLRPIQSQLAADFDGANFPYTTDIIDLSTASENLLRNIERDGKLLFVSDGRKIFMTLEQIKLKHEDFSRALKKLHTALEEDITANELFLDGLIQRFEFCFELSWKLMKAFLDYEGIEVNSPRSAIRKAFQTELIADAETWLDMLEKRSLSSHTYDAETALEIYRHVAQKYIFLFDDFAATIKDKFSD